MKRIHLYLWILGILVICVGATWYFTSKEGFQAIVTNTVGTMKTNTVGTTKTNFWALTTNTDPLITYKILRVSNPDPNDLKDTMPIKFSKYISMYSLAKYDDVSGARAALFNNYNQLQTDMSTNLYDQTTVAAWDSDPKTKTCNELDTIRNGFTQQIFALRSQVQDLSGTSVLASKMRDENYAYQDKYKSLCQGTPLSAACISLANQEGAVFSLLAKYENANNNIYEAEFDISNNIQTINDTYDLLQCDKSLKTGFIKMFGSPDIYYFNANTMKKYYVPVCDNICGMNLCSNVVELRADQMNSINKYTALETTPFTCATLYDGVVVKADNDLTKAYYIKGGMKTLISTCSMCSLDLCSRAKIVSAAALFTIPIAASSSPFACSLLPSGTTQTSLDSAGNMSFIIDNTIGNVDTTTLSMKLQQLSPYYLSPDTLKYITSSIISASDAKSSISASSDVIINIKNVIDNIKTLTTTA